MSEKLLPCPFCGGEARTFEYDGLGRDKRSLKQ
jgi:hypothetical protein